MLKNLDWLEYSTWGPTEKVPEHTHRALMDYLRYGYLPGSFLTAVLAGDLFKSAYTCDHVNHKALTDIARFIVDNLPHGSYGSYEIVRRWHEVPEVREAFGKQLTWHYLNTDNKPKEYDF